MTVNASDNTAKMLFGLVTRTSHTCVVAPASTAALTEMTMVLALTTSVPVTCGGVP